MPIHWYDGASLQCDGGNGRQAWPSTSSNAHVARTGGLIYAGPFHFKWHICHALQLQDETDLRTSVLSRREL